MAYLGIGKVYDFLNLTNEVLTDRGVELPLPGQSTTTPETRFAKGWAAQAQIVREDRLALMHESARPDEKRFQDWLTANCHGDQYTRGGLDLVTRELLTFVLLVAHGGCDPQVRGHVAGNLRMGNDWTRLIDVLSQLVPYIGYPRTLNGLAAINEVRDRGAGGGAMSDLHVLAVGATGSIGRHVLAAALVAGHRVQALVRDSRPGLVPARRRAGRRRTCFCPRGSCSSRSRPLRHCLTQHRSARGRGGGGAQRVR